MLTTNNILKPILYSLTGVNFQEEINQTNNKKKSNEITLIHSSQQIILSGLLLGFNECVIYKYIKR